MPRTPDTRNDDRQRRRGKRGSGETTSWQVVDPNILAALIHAVTVQGGAVRFGLSRDRTALALGFLGDGEPYTEWFRPTDNVEQGLLDITMAWNGEAPA